MSAGAGVRTARFVRRSCGSRSGHARWSAFLSKIGIAHHLPPICDRGFAPRSQIVHERRASNRTGDRVFRNSPALCAAANDHRREEPFPSVGCCTHARCRDTSNPDDDLQRKHILCCRRVALPKRPLHLAVSWISHRHHDRYRMVNVVELRTIRSVRDYLAYMGELAVTGESRAWP